MAFSDDRGIFGSVQDSYQNAVNFAGRSRRTDVVYFLIAASAATRLMGILLSMFLGLEEPSFGIMAFFVLLQWIFFLPFFALLGRRLQDFGITVWWSFFAIMPSVISLILFLSRINLAAIYPSLGLEFAVFGISSALVMLAAIFWPGDQEANAFGPNPRMD